MSTFQKDATMGDVYGPAMAITSQSEADRYFERIVDHILSLTEISTDDAMAMARMNLGYYAGYYGNETRERVERLFNCEHPVFGKIAEKGPPTAEEALQMGMNWSKKLREGEANAD